MKFYRPVRARTHLQVIPLIDILLVLLIFFVASTSFKKPRSILRIELPSVQEVPSDSTSAARSVIGIDAAGNITLDAVAVPEGLLETYLAAFQKQNPGRQLELEADKNLPLERLLKLWDSLTKAGIPVKDVPARITGK